MNEMKFLETSGVSKYYGGVTALKDVDFLCSLHSIHSILGENGAGKSTLIKVISGVVHAEEGKVFMDGQEVAFSGPAHAAAQGIVCVFQELSLVPDLTVADNICITNPPRKWGMIDARSQIHRAEELLARIGCEDINPRDRCSALPLSRRQMVEIAKALGRNPRLLILDEATSALTSADVQKVFGILRRLRDEGLAILYITHRLHEAAVLADTCTVFRNGERIQTFDQGSKTPDEIVDMMIGRAISKVFPDKPVRIEPPKPVLEVENLNWEDRLHGISFSVGKGEIVGLGGLDGQGQRELLLSLFGVMRGLSGMMKMDGRRVSIRSPAEAKARRIGIGLIPEDRKSEGLLLPMSVADNITLAALDQMAKALVVSRRMEKEKVDEMIRLLRIKIGSVNQKAVSLSGGNQQKVVVAKWLLTGARCLLLMDPTRGIDVGTKQEMYVLLRRLADNGTSILFYSTDYDELIGMCDRVIILYEGRIVRELKGDEITEQSIIAASLQVSTHNSVTG